MLVILNYRWDLVLLPSNFPKDLEVLWNPGYSDQKFGIPQLRKAISFHYHQNYNFLLPESCIAPLYAGRQGVTRSIELILKKIITRN